MASQVQSFWTGLDMRQRIVGALALVAVLATLYGISRVAMAPSMSLLYSGLDPAAAGEVITALETRDVAFEVRGDAIYIDAAQRDRVRLDLAASDLPAGGPAGYEILDGLSGFGTTSQMFDAAYWRAKEGELARTIASAPNIRSVRVHLANPVAQPFSRERTGSASVTVNVANGGLAEAQAEAIRYLVSSAVAGVSPESVAVIDAARGVVLSGDDDDPTKAGSARTDARADTLRRNIIRLLEAHVGAGKAIVEVNVAANMNSETISSRIIDPDSRIAISSETEENSEQSTGAAAAGVTVASNLPDGDVDGGGAESNHTSTQTRERQNFEVSETRSERVVLPGQVRRVDVAVIVDGIVETSPAGEEVWRPRARAEIEALEDLVKAAAGFDAERGDRITIRSLQLTPPPEQGTLSEGGEGGFVSRNAPQFIQTGILAAIVLALIFFVLRPMISGGQARQDITALTGEPAAPQPGPAEIEDQTGPPPLELPEQSVSKIDRLREVVSSRSEDSAAVLRSWIESPENSKEASGA